MVAVRKDCVTHYEINLISDRNALDSLGIPPGVRNVDKLVKRLKNPFCCDCEHTVNGFTHNIEIDRITKHKSSQIIRRSAVVVAVKNLGNNLYAEILFDSVVALKNGIVYYISCVFFII